MNDDYRVHTPVSRARQRYLARQRRHRQPMVTRIGENSTRPAPSQALARSMDRMRWNPPVKGKAAGAAVGVFTVLVLAVIIFGSQVPPNVWIFNMSLGGIPYKEAAQQLQAAWDGDTSIDLVAGERHWTANPADLGFQLDADRTVEQARGIGLAAIPFGYSLDPIFTFDANKARLYLADLADKVAIPPTSARYAWHNGTLTGLEGASGLSLDTEATLSRLADTRLDVIQARRFELTTTSLPSLAADPAPYYEDAIHFVSAPFQLLGYDPFRDQTFSWTAGPDNLASWIEAGAGSLVVRPVAVIDFVQAVNAGIGANAYANGAIYIDPQETIDAVNSALREHRDSALIRIRYRAGDYTVAAGDTAYRISRKTGIPFFLIEQVNSDRDLNVLSPGDIVHLPSRDVTLPVPPIANKRIIVDLETQSMAAYEDGQEMFRWPISSGIADAPTSPGIYEILSHDPVAYGSSYTLCGDLGCGQWEMNWFMGIYEVTPGLVNGFHGAVLLPNGAYLGGNNVGTPYTLGCIMARDAQAKLLYDWAEDGTVVEIISRDFPPQSDLARRAFGD